MELGLSEQVLGRMLHIIQTHKLPKVKAAAVEMYRLMMHKYGTHVVLPKPIAVHAFGLMDHKDGNVRKEALKLCIEMYRWLREHLKPMLEKYKPEVVQNVYGEETSVNKTITVLFKKLEPYFERVDAEPIPEVLPNLKSPSSHPQRPR